MLLEQERQNKVMTVLAAWTATVVVVAAAKIQRKQTTMKVYQMNQRQKKTRTNRWFQMLC